MSRKCELTGKSPLKGHKVSHANNKVKRKFFPNLKKKTFTSSILKKNIKLNVTNSALRSVDKSGGIDFITKSKKTKKIVSIEKLTKLIDEQVVLSVIPFYGSCRISLELFSSISN